MPWAAKKPSKLDILKIKDLKTTNRDRKKANKQDIRYYSIESNGQDNIQLPLQLSLKLQIPILTHCTALLVAIHSHNRDL